MERIECYICGHAYQGARNREDRCPGHVDLREHLSPMYQHKLKERRQVVNGAVRFAAVEAARRHMEAKRGG